MWNKILIPYIYEITDLSNNEIIAMTEHDRLKRLLELMIYLSSGIRRSLAETARRFEVSERTVLRYVRTFREAGFIIPRPQNGLYYIDKNSPYFREIDELLHFSREEAYILQKAIHSISDENLLKHNLIKKLYALYDFDRVAKTIVKKEHSECIHQLMKAIKERKKVILRGYLSANSNEMKDRIVEPFDFTTNYVATWAYDTADKSCKTFKNTRISSVQLMAEKQQHEADHKKLPIDIFRISGEQQTTVILRLSIRACELLKEEYPLSEEYIKQVNEGLFELRAPVCSFEGVGRFVMGLSNDIKVVGPKELIVFLKEKAIRFLNDIT
jgi:predicted DNA-binding transcriptional regulator YafY